MSNHSPAIAPTDARSVDGKTFTVFFIDVFRANYIHGFEFITGTTHDRSFVGAD